jgi:hypothetical protein
MIFPCLQEIGCAEVSVWTRTIADWEVEAMGGLMARQEITSGRLVIDACADRAERDRTRPRRFSGSGCIRLTGGRGVSCAGDFEYPAVPPLGEALGRFHQIRCRIELERAAFATRSVRGLTVRYDRSRSLVLPGTGAFAVTRGKSNHDASAVSAHCGPSQAFPALASSSQREPSLADFTACLDSVLKSQQPLSPQQAGLQHEGLQPAAQQQV